MNNWLGPIYKRYYANMLKKLLKRGLSEENAEDVISATVISLLQNKELRQDGATALLTRSVQLNALHVGRYDKPTINSFEAAHFETPEIAYMQKQDVLEFYRCLELVPDKAREALELKLDGYYNQSTKGNCKHALKVLQLKMKLNSAVVKHNVAYATKGEL